MTAHLTPPIDLAATRERLLAERARLMEEAAELAYRQQHVDAIRVRRGMGEDGSGGDPGDAAAALFEIELAGRLSVNVRAHLEDVMAALARLDAGGYGLCETCRAPIDRERLIALPWARRCLNCQRQEEHRRARMVDQAA